MTNTIKPSRLPWVIAGVLGCLVVCLLLVLVGVGAFAFGGRFFALAPTKAEVPISSITRAPSGPTGPTSASAVPTLPAPLPSQATPVVPPPTVPSKPSISTTPPAPPTAAVKQPPTQAVPKGKLAFSVCEGNCDSDDKRTVWIMNADGTGAKKVIERASEPSFSPDGNQIVYYHWSDGIYIVNSDGTDPSLISSAANPLDPGQKPTPVSGKKIVADTVTGIIEWSHDGRWVAFSSRPGGQGNVNIDVAPPDGTALKDSNARRTIVVGIGPSWSPDDTQFVFNTCRGGTCGIYKSGTAPGSEANAIVGDNGNAPAWSPDGKKILYQVEVDGPKQLVVINPDGTGKKQLTSGAIMHVGGSWSLDGNYIYYRSPEGGSWGIWRMNADGSNPVKLLDNVPPVDWAFERISVGR